VSHQLERPTETVEYKDWASKLWGVRTVLQGLALDVGVGVTLFLLTVIGNLEWTRTYWILLGLGVAKSAIQAVVAYMARRLLPPQQR
jgi:vacuolar-type H+-ATPase subunit I/STV1